MAAAAKRRKAQDLQESFPRDAQRSILAACLMTLPGAVAVSNYFSSKDQVATIYDGPALKSQLEQLSMTDKPVAVCVKAKERCDRICILSRARSVCVNPGSLLPL
jgi:hypothetical protein